METTTVKKIGSPDYGHVYAVCTCGWQGTCHSRRTAEGTTLAHRDADDHRKANHV